MFSFGKSTRDPLADAKTVGRWLDNFPAGDPLAVHGEVLAELGRIAERTARRTPQRLEAVFELDALTMPLRDQLTTQYIEHASRSSKIEHQLWSALFDLTQAFLLAYQAFAREVPVHAQSAKWQQLLPELVCRQIVHLGLDAKTRLYRFEQWIPAKWAELHGLFSLACSKQLERAPLALVEGSTTTTIEHEFLVVLLLQLMNAGNLTPRHLQWIGGELSQWCAPLRLTIEPSSVTSFYVDFASREGLRRRPAGPLEGRVLFLDTRPLHATLMQNAVMLDQKMKSEPLSNKTPRRTEQLNLLHKLAAQVDPEFRPFARRGERTAAAGTVDAIVGFSKITGYLKEEERNPIPQITPGDSFGGTLELAVFGRARNELDRRLELARRRLAAFAAPGGPWEVKDVSQTGFRLVAPMSVANAVTLNTLAAIRPHGQAVWTLGIVRRMKRLTADRAEIGLQIIANTLLGVDLMEQRKNVDEDYSVDGEAITINGRAFGALLLALRKREGDTPVQSLIVPGVEYQASKRFRLVTSKSSSPIRFGRLIEQQPDWVWTAVEPLELGDSLLGTSTLPGTNKA
ncbi:MAG TPA: hypothetical protein VGI14_22540 [Casimicrobiaceae bacterium]|jgi:hypothetical protein